MLLSPSKSQNQVEKPTKISGRSVAPLLIGTFILRANTGAGSIILGRLLAQLSLQQGHPISNIHVGLIAVTYFIVELSLAPIMGAISDRTGRRFFLTIGPLIGFAHVALIIFTPAQNPLPYLLCIQILAGVATAMQVPAVLGYLADYAVGYLVVAVCMFLIPRVKQVIVHSKLKATIRRYWQVLRTPRLFIFIPAWLSFSALIGIWLSAQLTYVLSSATHNPDQSLMGIFSAQGGGGRLSLVLGAYVLFFGLCLLFWAFFLNRVPRLLLMLSSITGVYLACIALAGINHFGTGKPGLMVIWIVMLMVGIFAESSFAPAALSYLADISEGVAKDRGLLMGLYSVFLGLGQLLGGGLGGIFAQIWGFNGLIYLTALLAFVALISLLMLLRMERRVEYVE